MSGFGSGRADGSFELTLDNGDSAEYAPMFAAVTGDSEGGIAVIVIVMLRICDPDPLGLGDVVFATAREDPSVEDSVYWDLVGNGAFDFDARKRLFLIITDGQP